MTKNLAIGVFIVVVILLGGYLFLTQPKNTKTIGNVTFPSPTAQAPATQVPAQTGLPQSTSSAQTGSQSANMITMADGLQYQDLTVGTGQEAKAGDTVTVNYVGKLTNGQIFDSSYDRNQPFTTQIGVGQVIKGWDEGIPGMKVGGKRELIIPPSLGYGAQGAGPIPPNSTLVFLVELLSVK